MLVIFGSPLSSPTNKVRYVANYLNIHYEFHLINLKAGEQRNPEYLKINPYGKIPAINDEGFKLAESNAIIRYLADKCSSALYPKESHFRAIVDQWMDYASQHIMVATSKIMWNTYFYKLMDVPKDERSLRDGHTFIEQYLPVVEQQLSHHDYITGDSLTLADIALLAALDTAELCQIKLSSYPYLNGWRNKLMNEAFYKKCHESYTVMFNKMMEKKANKVTT